MCCREHWGVGVVENRCREVLEKSFVDKWWNGVL